MKVLYISTFYGSSLESGAEKSTRIWAQLLREKDVDVKILTLSRKPSLVEDNIILVNHLVPNYFLGGTDFLDRVISKYIYNVIMRENPDIVHIQDLFSLPPTIRIKEKIGIPMVATIRDPLPKKEIGISNHPYYLITNIWLRKRQPIWIDALKKCDGIVAISNFIRNSLKRLGFKKNIKVIYNPVLIDEIFKKPFNSKIIKIVEKLSRKFKILFFAARMHYEKGIDIAIRALKYLPENVFKRVVLLLAGNGPYLTYFKNLARKIGVSERVIFLGYLDHRTVLEIYKYTFLTLLLPRFEEPLGRTAVESMYFGVPVIATKVGGLKEIIIDGKTGFLVDKEDYKSVARKIVELFDDEEMYKEMGISARNFVNERFNNEDLISKMLSFYKSFIRKV